MQVLLALVPAPVQADLVHGAASEMQDAAPPMQNALLVKDSASEIQDAAPPMQHAARLPPSARSNLQF